MRTELCFSRATQLRFEFATVVYFIHRPALDAEVFRRPEFWHDRRLIALPSPGRQPVCPLRKLRRLGPLPPERGAARIFSRKRILEGRSHSERRAGGSSAHGIGTIDGSGARRQAFIPRIPFQRIDGPEPHSFSRPRSLARFARFSRSALEPRVPGACITVARRSSALLARPALLQTGAPWRRGGLAPGLFVLDENDAFGPPHLLDWLG